MKIKRGEIDTRLTIGLAVVFIGVLLFIRNVDPELGSSIWRWWPSAILLIGLKVLIQPPENRQIVHGTIITFVGLLLLLNNLDVIELSFRYIWPVIFILIGLAIVLHSAWWRKAAPGRDFINLTLVFGGGEFNYNSRDFRGGKVTAIMGGGSIDLREANPVSDEIMLDVLAIMGGVEIRVPTNWQVILEGTPIFGGMANKTVSAGAKQDAGSGAVRRLKIKGMTIMGGVEVKN
jgi:predicted membrane protein